MLKQQGNMEKKGFHYSPPSNPANDGIFLLCYLCKKNI